VPEVWENWLSFIELMYCFLDYLLYAVKREVCYEDIRSGLGQIIVQVRFMSKLVDIQSMEDSIFSL
jgi:hypothetical protein